jgi:hypothetical protein
MLLSSWLFAKQQFEFTLTRFRLAVIFICLPSNNPKDFLVLLFPYELVN